MTEMMGSLHRPVSPPHRTTSMTLHVRVKEKQKYPKGFTPPDSSREDSAGINDEEFYVRYDYQNLPIVNFEFNAIRNVCFLDENLHLAFIHPHAITLQRG